jgi:hypothetical protein
MDTTDPKPLGRAEAMALRQLAEGETDSLIDWVALQHLKRRGFAEETPPTGWRITEAGRRANRGHIH